MTKAAIIRDEDAQQKMIFGDNHIYPRVAILDPELTVGMPGAITAGTGLDALTHAFEALHAMQAEPMADALALHAIRLVARHLPTALASPGDLVARGQMLLASTMAGLAFDNAAVGLVHAIAHSVGARHHVHHGTANAIALPHVLRFNADVAAAAEAYRGAANAIGIVTVGSPNSPPSKRLLALAITALVGCVRAAHAPPRRGREGEQSRDLAEITLFDGCIVYNPKPVTEASEVMTVLRAAY